MDQASISLHAPHPSTKKLRRRLKKILGFTPGKSSYYERAFIHRSVAITGPHGEPYNNERLEFLGDAVLDAVVSDYLFLHYPSGDEGFLSRLRSLIVRRETLNQLAREVGLEEFLISHTETNRKVKHLWGNSFEALVGAVYLDKGYKKTRKFILNRILKNYLDLSRLQEDNRDFKSHLVEWAQKNRASIDFVVDSFADENHELVFTTRILLNNETIGTGRGYSKKESEQQAASRALTHIGV